MISAATVLSSIPKGLRDPLVKAFNEIASNYAEHRWEPLELNGGKLCEIVYTILDGYIAGAYASTPSKPSNMLAACQALERIPASATRIGDRSIRVLIPRMIVALYEIRNNRGVGHAGGDVDPNYLDATAVYSIASWIVAELIRIFHNIPTREAQEFVDVLIERKHPIIWEVDNIRRVLDPTMKTSDQVLLLLHTKPGWVSESSLLASVEYSSLALFKNRILIPYHTQRLLEYDRTNAQVRISPLGVVKAEEILLKYIPF